VAIRVQHTQLAPVVFPGFREEHSHREVRAHAQPPGVGDVQNSVINMRPVVLPLRTG
jgi:hypothetical protein